MSTNVIDKLKAHTQLTIVVHHTLPCFLESPLKPLCCINGFFLPSPNLHKGEARHDEGGQDAVAEGVEDLQAQVHAHLVQLEENHDKVHEHNQKLGAGQHQEARLGGDDLRGGAAGAGPGVLLGAATHLGHVL